MKVLIIDDESLIRRSLRRAFESHGFKVYEAVDGDQGLRVWREVAPDVVLLDVLMPGYTGPQVLNQIQQISGRGGAKVILISAYTGEYNLNKAHDLGADLFLPKPFQDVFDVVRKAQNLLEAE